MTSLDNMSLNHGLINARRRPGEVPPGLLIILTEVSPDLFPLFPFLDWAKPQMGTPIVATPKLRATFAGRHGQALFVAVT